MTDTETLTDVISDKKPVKATEPDETNSDFPSMGVDLIKRINVKIAVFLLIIGLFVFSDIFIEKFLASPNFQDGTGCTNTTGTSVQLIILVLSYIVIDLLSQGGIL
jgi:hypothetical protein